MDPAPLGWRLAARSRGALGAPSRPPRQESFRLLRRAVAFYLDGPIVLRRIEVCQRPEHPRRLRLGFSDDDRNSIVDRNWDLAIARNEDLRRAADDGVDVLPRDPDQRVGPVQDEGDLTRVVAH